MKSVKVPRARKIVRETVKMIVSMFLYLLPSDGLSIPQVTGFVKRFVQIFYYFFAIIYRLNHCHLLLCIDFLHMCGLITACACTFQESCCLALTLLLLTYFLHGAYTPQARRARPDRAPAQVPLLCMYCVLLCCVVSVYLLLLFIDCYCVVLCCVCCCVCHRCVCLCMCPCAVCAS